MDAMSTTVPDQPHKGRYLTLVTAFPLVAATVAVAALAGVLTAAYRPAVAWLLSIYCGIIALRALISMIKEAMAGSWGLDILAVTAIAATIAVGEYWASLVIVLMVTGGEALEEYAGGRAQKDLTSLISNAPHVAHVLSDAGSTVTDSSLDAVPVGAHIVVRPGEMVPLDGSLVSDVGVFDASSLTGESVPVEAVAGDEVLSGSLNGANAVTIAVTRPAADSQYQRICALVADAAASKSPMVRLANRYALPFTLVAFAIAGSAWAITGQAMRFAEVLVVATPCPLLISAPVAFMGGMSRAARRGIIIRSSASLEQLYKAKSFAFDKTGTLTQGSPSLDRLQAVEIDPDRLLTLAASAEQFSAHVLAQAIVSGAIERGLSLTTPTDVVEVTGGGVSAMVGAQRVVVGKHAYVMGALGGASVVAEPPLVPGELAVHVAVDGQYRGCVVIRDQVRPQAHSTIDALRDLGISDIAMLTGDEQATASHIASQVGISEVLASCLPADKVAALHAMTQRPVVMVGDGVNDAPVLAAADVGIAMAAKGATAASETADVVIMPDDVGRVAETLAIGQQTVRVALRAIWIGIALSIGLMIIATLGWLPAIAGAWLQEAVDLASILWALRAASGLLPRISEATA